MPAEKAEVVLGYIATLEEQVQFENPKKLPSSLPESRTA